MDAALAKQLMEASIEFGYNAHKNGMTLDHAVRRYNAILEEFLERNTNLKQENKNEA